MRNTVILLLALLAITSCKTDKDAIEYKKISNLNLGNLNKEHTTLKATAEFMNVSDETLVLKNMVLEFTVDGKNMGTIVSKGGKTIAPKSEFSVPVKYSYETAALVEAGHDPSAQYAVKLTGDLTYRNANNEEITIPVKYSDSYEFQTPKEERLDKRQTRKEERRKRKEQKTAEQ